MQDRQGKKEFELLLVQNGNVINFWKIEIQKNYTIGRHPFDNDIVVYDTTISKTHAIFQIIDEDRAQIMDLKTRNHTMINNQKLISNCFINIFEGDKIFLGAANFYLMFKSKNLNDNEDNNYDAGTRFKVAQTKYLKKK